MELRRDYFVGPSGEECDDIGDIPFMFKGMKKMNKKDAKNFPSIVAGSVRCQMYYIAKFERCYGCDFAVEGCEKVVEMSAG